MEKKGVAVTASLVLVALLSGILLGGTVARPPPVTITSQTTVEKTVTVAETTVEVPVKHQPAPYSALAYTACIYDKTLPDEDRECDKNTKAVYIAINFRELGTENSYLRLDRVTVIAPGLVGNVAAEGMPLDAMGRVVVMPRSSASISVKIRSGPYSAPLTGLTVEVFTPFNTRSSSSGLNLMTRRIPIPKKRTLA
jgi:hypothetical protein